MSDAITTAIDRFILAEKRVQGLSASRHDDDDEIVIAYAERTEALLGLLRWDKADPIATAIRALVRAQDRLQGHSDSTTTYRDLSPEARGARRRPGRPRGGNSATDGGCPGQTAAVRKGAVAPAG